MSSTPRYHEVATLKVRVYEETMTVESHEIMLVEENPEGDFPERQTFMRISTESSDDEDTRQLAGFNPRMARRAKRVTRPPARMPTGQLLNPQEAKIRRGLFSIAHKDRKSYVKGLIKRYKPREVFVRKYRQMIKVHDGPAVPREESCDSIEDLVLEDRDNQENEDPDGSESNASVEEEDNEQTVQNDTTDSDGEGPGREGVEGGWYKRRRVETSSDTETDSTDSSIGSLLESSYNF